MPWPTISAACLVLALLATLTLVRRGANTPANPQAPPPARGAAGPIAPQVPPARLAFEFEHSLKIGLLRIWVDRELVVEQRTDNSASSISTFRFRKGEDQEFLELPAGGHDVEVQVVWDGTEKTEHIWGDLKGGTTRRLKARVGGLFKHLSLQWQ